MRVEKRTKHTNFSAPAAEKFEKQTTAIARLPHFNAVRFVTVTAPSSMNAQKGCLTRSVKYTNTQIIRTASSNAFTMLKPCVTPTFTLAGGLKTKGSRPMFVDARKSSGSGGEVWRWEGTWTVGITNPRYLQVYVHLAQTIRTC